MSDIENVRQQAGLQVQILRTHLRTMNTAMADRSLEKFTDAYSEATIAFVNLSECFDKIFSLSQDVERELKGVREDLERAQNTVDKLKVSEKPPKKAA